MARTRGASQVGVFHMDDGEALDKEGKPLDVSGQFVPRAPAAHGVPAPVAPKRYICNAKTFDRNMEAYELALILDLVMGGIAIELPQDEWAKLPADARRHFRVVN